MCKIQLLFFASMDLKKNGGKKGGCINMNAGLTYLAELF